MKNMDFLNTKLATEADFRTDTGVLKMNFEYYESSPYSKIWQMQLTDSETDREWLKTKIALNFIRVPLVDTYWNLKNSADTIL